MGVRSINSWLTDRRYGGSLSGRYRSRFDLANDEMGTDYWVLDELFATAQIPIDASDVLVDVGCGRGRVLNYWLSRGYKNRLVGVELDPMYADATRERLKRFPNVTIETGSASKILPADGTLFYAYNPFPEVVWQPFKQVLEQHAQNVPRLTLLYYNSHHVGAFENDPHWQVRHLGPINALNAAVATYKSGVRSGNIDAKP